ncbi:MAG: hypothetical protein DHS80DRAFT_22660 [Piptocephalis tieghemiana]|nr:MAG: hypothetical protein DHS80DRAFT_22660 [Piptocephalis tieghemiana]
MKSTATTSAPITRGRRRQSSSATSSAPHPSPPPAPSVSKSSGTVSPSDESAPSLARKPKRIQVKKACVNCHNVSKKCEDARPCARCIKKGLENECVDFEKKKRQSGIRRGPYRKDRKVLSSSSSSASSMPKEGPRTRSSSSSTARGKITPSMTRSNKRHNINDPTSHMHTPPGSAIKSRHPGAMVHNQGRIWSTHYPGAHYPASPQEDPFLSASRVAGASAATTTAYQPMYSASIAAGHYYPPGAPPSVQGSSIPFPPRAVPPAPMELSAYPEMAYVDPQYSPPPGSPEEVALNQSISLPPIRPSDSPSPSHSPHHDLSHPPRHHPPHHHHHYHHHQQESLPHINHLVSEVNRSHYLPPPIPPHPSPPHHYYAHPPPPPPSQRPSNSSYDLLLGAAQYVDHHPSPYAPHGTTTSAAHPTPTTYRPYAGLPNHPPPHSIPPIHAPSSSIAPPPSYSYPVNQAPSTLPLPHQVPQGPISQNTLSSTTTTSSSIHPPPAPPHPLEEGSQGRVGSDRRRDSAPGLPPPPFQVPSSSSINATTTSGSGETTEEEHSPIPILPLPPRPATVPPLPIPPLPSSSSSSSSSSMILGKRARKASSIKDKASSSKRRHSTSDSKQHPARLDYPLPPHHHRPKLRENEDESMDVDVEM